MGDCKGATTRRNVTQGEQSRPKSRRKNSNMSWGPSNASTACALKVLDCRWSLDNRCGSPQSKRKVETAQDWPVGGPLATRCVLWSAFPRPSRRLWPSAPLCHGGRPPSSIGPPRVQGLRTDSPSANPRPAGQPRTPRGGAVARRVRAGHLFGPVPHQWPFRGCTKGAHLAQCSYLGVWLY